MKVSGLTDAKIMIVGLNPAWQKILIFDEIHSNAVNRATQVLHCSAGKAANFARASIIGGGRPTLFQFAGGTNGALLLEDMRKENIPNVTVINNSPTRCCITCIDLKKHNVSELIEPSENISRTSARKLLSIIKNEMNKFNGIVICGTYPPGIDGNFYAEIALHAKKYGIPVMLDAWNSVDKILEQGINILKINSKEIKAIAGKRSITESANYIFNNFKITEIAVTDGAKGAYLFSHEGIFKFVPPEIAVINSIGAGDTVAGIFFTEYLKTGKTKQSFGKAIGAGTASCLSLIPGKYDLAKAKKLAPSVNFIAK